MIEQYDRQQAAMVAAIAMLAAHETCRSMLELRSAFSQKPEGIELPGCGAVTNKCCFVAIQAFVSVLGVAVTETEYGREPGFLRSSQEQLAGIESRLDALEFAEAMQARAMIEQLSTQLEELCRTYSVT